MRREGAASLSTAHRWGQQRWHGEHSSRHSTASLTSATHVHSRHSQAAVWGSFKTLEHPMKARWSTNCLGRSKPCPKRSTQGNLLEISPWPPCTTSIFQWTVQYKALEKIFVDWSVELENSVKQKGSYLQGMSQHHCGSPQRIGLFSFLCLHLPQATNTDVRVTVEVPASC